MSTPQLTSIAMKSRKAAAFFPFAYLLSALFILSCSPASSNEEQPRPNILLLVADDLGYADPGCYGGDIETPNIDALAARGIRFSRFHTAPMCAPTRAMLLSGNDNHIAGMGRQSLRTQEFGYEGHLSERIATIPQVLRAAGYHTYMAGKWHLGTAPEHNPHQKGFEHSFVLLEGAGNHYDNQGLFENAPVSPYTEDGRTAQWKKGDYSTDFYTGKLIEYIDRHRSDGRPFFAFAAYTSPHWPLQVDEKYWKKYEGRYDEGYEKLKEKRLESLKRAGMIPAGTTLPPNHPRVTPRDSLSPEQQRVEARKMELYAGMVDNLDHNIGRLIQHLKDIGAYDNTLIVFMSDNGAAAEDFYYNDHYGPFIRQHFTDDYEVMGQPHSFISYGPQWAEAGSAPFRYFKGQTTEGGMIAPMIIAGPGVERRREIAHQFTTLMDLAPTIYEAAQTQYPESFNEKPLYPLKGASLLPFTTGEAEQIHDPDYVFALEHGGRAMLRKGDWKITNLSRPFSVDSFQLYRITKDLAEMQDRKAEEPEKFRELTGEWERYVEEVRVQFPTPRE